MEISKALGPGLRVLNQYALRYDLPSQIQTLLDRLRESSSNEAQQPQCDPAHEQEEHPSLPFQVAAVNMNSHDN